MSEAIRNIVAFSLKNRFFTFFMVLVLVIELIPLTAVLFVAMRCTIPNGK